MLAHRLGLPGIDAVASAGFQHALPAVALKLLVGRGARVLLGQHLGQNAVAQPHIRVAEAGQREVLQQLGIHVGAGDDDLGTSRSDARNRAASVILQLRELVGEAFRCPEPAPLYSFWRALLALLGWPRTRRRPCPRWQSPVERGSGDASLCLAAVRAR